VRTHEHRAEPIDRARDADAKGACPRRRRRRGTALAPCICASVLALLGCVDPQARYDAFLARSADARGHDAGTPDPGDRFDFSGHYLLALSTTLAPDSPLLFGLDVEVASDLSTVQLHFQPLTTDADAEPRKKVGDALDPAAVPYAADGTFSADLGEVTVPGRANPITGSDIVATVQLQATTRAPGATDGGDAGDAAEVCGQITGMVSMPLPLDLAGSTFGAVRTASDEDAIPRLRCP